MKLSLSRPWPAYRSTLVVTRLAGVLACALFLQGCPEDGSSFGFKKPNVAILPSSPSGLDDLVAGVTIENPPGQTPTFSYAWSVIAGGTGPDPGPGVGDVNKVPGSATSKGETWQVRVTAVYPNGRRVGPGIATVVVGNSPPTVDADTQLVTNPSPACMGDAQVTFTVNFTTADADGDPVTARLVWTFDPDGPNNPAQPEVEVAVVEDAMTGAMLTFDYPGGSAQTGNTVRATVTPFDGEDFGTLDRSVGGIPRNSSRTGCPRPVPAAPGSGSGGSDPQSAASSSLEANTASLLSLAAASRTLSVGTFEVCSIGTGGGVSCQGAEGSALTDPPQGNFSQVLVGTDYACALETDTREIRCWGEVPEDSALLTPPEGPFVLFALGDDAACALRDAGQIACWGSDDSPLLQAPEGSFTEVEIAGAYACAIEAETEATVCWGD